MTAGEAHELGDLIRRHVAGPGRRWKTRGQIFKAAGWRTASVVATGAAGEKEPVVVLTDLPPHGKVLARDDRRFGIEPGFRHHKTRGWRWEDSPVQGLAHPARLLLALWASLIRLCIGVEEAQERLAQRAERPAPGPRPQHPRESLFTLGLRQVRRWLDRTTHRPRRWRLLDLDSLSWCQRWYPAQALRAPFKPVRP